MAPRQTKLLASSSSSSSLSPSPKLIVFDLDNTLWTPELYQLRKLQRAGKTPVAGKDVKLFPGARQVIEEIVRSRKKKYNNDDEVPRPRFAIASRTQSVEWAHALLGQFGIRELFDHVEIFPADKKEHFFNLQKASGIAFEDMLFFDDARDGRYGNCEPVSSLGVLSVHCPGGIDSYQVFQTAMERFRTWDRTPNTIVEWDGSITKGERHRNLLQGGRQQGVIKTVNADKGFGFIRRPGNLDDVFFHFNNLPVGAVIERGEEVSFVVKRNQKNGKFFASEIEKLSKDSEDTLEMHAFSMNLPFAALLANGYKDLETRNGTMFVPYPQGTQMLLHVGQRIYPDGNRHVEVLKEFGGLSDKEIAKLKSLPKGFSKGSVVAILELGRTYESTVQERSTPEVQRRVTAFGADSGKMVTEIKRVAYLKRPVKISGKGGVFKATIPSSVLPNGWQLSSDLDLLERSQRSKVGTHDSDKASGKTPVYEISG